MAKNTLKAVAKIDPTLPFTPIEIKGETYKMCFTFRAIAKAEARLRQQGHDVVLLNAMVQLTFGTVPIVLAASLGTFHPELPLEFIEHLVDYDNVWQIAHAMKVAWADAMPKGEEANPPEPVQS